MGIHVCTNEGLRPSKRIDNWEKIKINSQLLKIFSRTTGPISTKLGTKYPWVKGIQVCSNEGPRPFQRGDNWEIIKINRQLLKIFSRTNGPFSNKLGTKYRLLKGIQICSMKDHALP